MYLMTDDFIYLMAMTDEMYSPHETKDWSAILKTADEMIRVPFPHTWNVSQLPYLDM